MCGIVGYLGNKNAASVVMSGLKRLEYRGYDSAGLAVHQNNAKILQKSVGRLKNLEEQICLESFKGQSALGHTRWATHGIPSFDNAHPHRYGRVSVVHNGIIENFRGLKNELMVLGRQFYSHTDTEVIAHLLDDILQSESNILQAIRKLCEKINGAYALGIMIEGEGDKLFFAKNGSPLVVAQGDDECFFASDQNALVDYQPKYYPLDDHEYGFISKNEIQIFDHEGRLKKFELHSLTARSEAIEKNGHRHFMHKEIFEQCDTVRNALLGRIKNDQIDFDGFDLDFEKIINAETIHIIACGSSYFAGLVAKPLLEKLLRIPVSVEIASEYRYRETLCNEKTLVIAISQSGETADTLAALKKVQDCDAMLMSVCNVVGSAIARLCEKSVGNLFINAGPEISVCSTKAFIGQLTCLKIFSVALAKKRKNIFDDSEIELIGAFKNMAEKIKNILALDENIRALAQSIIDQKKIFYLARGDLYPVALEGALKMKEISYIFAEGYPAGELKHGPIAIIEQDMPAVVIFGNDGLHHKTLSNVSEIKARGARVIGVAPKSLTEISEECDELIVIDDAHPMVAPILATIPLQLLAYHLSDLRGFDVDKPRNLAKSVTVE